MNLGNSYFFKKKKSQKVWHPFRVYKVKKVHLTNEVQYHNGQSAFSHLKGKNLFHLSSVILRWTIFPPQKWEICIEVWGKDN